MKKITQKYISIVLLLLCFIPFLSYGQFNKYDYVSHHLSNNRKIAKLNGKWGYVNKRMKTVIPFEFDEVKTFKGKVAWVRKNNKWGLINKRGKMRTAFIYDRFEDFTDGLALIKRDNKYGYINIKGKEIVIPQYTSAKSFKNGGGKVSIEKKRELLIEQEKKSYQLLIIE